MFKLLFGLCAGLYLALQFAPDDGKLRDGLRGAYAPLVTDVPEPEVARAPDAPAPAAAPAAVARVTPPVAPEAATGVVSAAFVAPEAAAEVPQDGLTLALPLVEAEDAEPAASPVQTAPGEPLVQYVIGSTVNVRSGPSADTESLGKLSRGEAVLVIATDTPGWSMIRIEGDGMEGYIASRFLGDAAPDTAQDALFGTD
jgi:hypothetical protein